MKKKTTFLPALWAVLLGMLPGFSLHAQITFTNYTTPDLGDNMVNAVRYDAANPVIAAATDGGLSISLDGGANWSNFTSGDGLGTDVVNDIFSSNGVFLTIATNGGVSISTNGGGSWNNYTTTNGLGSDMVNAIQVYSLGGTPTIFAATDAGLSFSTNAGSSWSNLTTADGLASNLVRDVWGADDRLHIATDMGVGITNTGSTATWNNYTTTNGLPTNDINAVFATGREVFAATEGGGLSISADDGVSWTTWTISDGLGSNSVNDVFALTDILGYATYIFAATDNGLSISLDAGATWTNYTTTDGLADNVVNAVRGDDTNLYVGTASGLSVIQNYVSVATPPANDECVDAFPITFDASMTFRDTVDATNATFDVGGLETCDEGSVWYQLSVPADGAFMVQTYNTDGDCANDDTELAIYSGTDCTNLTALTDLCVDNDDTNCSRHERATVGVTAGQTIWIAVSRNDGPDGIDQDDPIFGVLFHLAVNDDCVNATEVMLAADAMYQDTIFGNAFTDAANECDDGGVWYEVDVAAGGLLTVTTYNTDGDCDSDDTELAIYSGTDCNSLTALVSCQDSDNTDCDNHETAAVKVNAGDKLWIAVSSRSDGDMLDYGLRIEHGILPANDDCTTATAVSLSAGATYETMVDLSTVTDGTDENCSEGAVWYQFQAPTEGDYVISTYSISGNCSTGTDDTQLSVFSTTSNCGNLVGIEDCLDNDGAGCLGHETTTLSLSAGERIYLAVNRNIVDGNPDPATEVGLRIEVPERMANPEPLPLQSNLQGGILLLLTLGMAIFAVYRIKLN